ncbi:BMP family protein [Acidiphilium sp.]|uniref:BMP family protein n=1 Tax=Acidiphilium sp. TaxID=527 RepID=UPI00258F25CC|nr:BMP family protein [Acidiphilium sp.]
MPNGGQTAWADGPVPIGVLIPGSKTDKGWMESAYDGMLESEAKYGNRIKVTYIENVAMGDMEQALTTLAAKNPLVIAAAGQAEAATLKVAKRFGHVKFAVVGGARADANNVSIYDVRQAEIAYVAGAAAAMLSKHGAVSYVGGMQIPAIVNAGKEFGLGARSVNPDIKYFESYTGNFDDVAKAKEATLAAIAQGADIHYNILNLGVRGMEQAAREKGTHMIGSYSNRCGTDPLYIAYSITGTGYILSYAIDQFVAGTWEAGFKPFGLMAGPKASNMVVCQPTPSITAKIDEIKKDLIAGKIQTLGS